MAEPGDPNWADAVAAIGRQPITFTVTYAQGMAILVAGQLWRTDGMVEPQRTNLLIGLGRLEAILMDHYDNARSEIA